MANSKYKNGDIVIVKKTDVESKVYMVEGNKDNNKWEYLLFTEGKQIWYKQSELKPKE